MKFKKQNERNCVNRKRQKNPKAVDIEDGKIIIQSYQ